MILARSDYYFDLAIRVQERAGGPVTSTQLGRDLLLTGRMVRHYLKRWATEGKATRVQDRSGTIPQLWILTPTARKTRRAPVRLSSDPYALAPPGGSDI